MLLWSQCECGRLACHALVHQLRDPSPSTKITDLWPMAVPVGMRSPVSS